MNDYNKIPFVLLDLVERSSVLGIVDDDLQQQLNGWAKEARKRISKEGLKTDWWMVLPKTKKGS